METKNEQDELKKTREQYDSLGRDICAVFIDNRMGISFNTARKKYVGEEKEIDPFWCVVAKEIDHMNSDRMNQTFQTLFK